MLGPSRRARKGIFTKYRGGDGVGVITSGEAGGAGADGTTGSWAAGAVGADGDVSAWDEVVVGVWPEAAGEGGVTIS